MAFRRFRCSSSSPCEQHPLTQGGKTAAKPQKRGSRRHSPRHAACRVGRLALAECAVRPGVPAKGQPAVRRHLAHLRTMPGCSACAMRVVCMRDVMRSGATGTVPHSRARHVQKRSMCPKAQHVRSRFFSVHRLQAVWYSIRGMYMFKWLLQGALMTAVIVVSL